MKLGLYDKAMEDYAKLEELGVNMSEDDAPNLLSRMSRPPVVRMCGATQMMRAMSPKCCLLCRPEATN